MQHESIPAATPKGIVASRANVLVPRSRLGGKRGDLLAALGFLAPNFLGFMLFVTFPILFSLYLVFTNWSLIPAIEKQWIGAENIRLLLGFRAVGEAGSQFSFCTFIGSYILIAGGILYSLIAFARKSNGVRLAGWIAIATGVSLVAESIITHSNAGWALCGVTLIFAASFFVLDVDARFAGRAIAGPLLLSIGIIGARMLKTGFAEQWEPLDPLFWKYLHNTLFLMFVIPIQIAGSLALALTLSKPIFNTPNANRWMMAAVFLALAILGGAGLAASAGSDACLLWMVFWTIAAMGPIFGVTAFRTLFFLPSFTAGVAVMLLWKQMYNPDFGLLNDMLRRLLGLFNVHADLPRWIHDPAWSKPALILLGFWATVGGTNMLIYLAGLANIPDELYEASRIDGASKWQEFINITWPQLAPTTFFIVIMSTIAGLQGGFEQARIMTEGGPAGSSKTLSYYIYEKAFQELSLGYASAIAWIMFLLIFLLTALNWKFGNQYVND